MKKTKAFSLVELSIVLIIIGLLVAGVSSGQKLIKMAKYKRIAQEMDNVEMALKTFNLTYDALPGDMPNAEDLWGTYNASSNPTGTVNGNGDGSIDHYGSGTTRESIRAWQQLSSKADLLPGNYSGVEGSSGAITVGTQVPESAYGNGLAYDFWGQSNEGTIGWNKGGKNFTWHAKKVSWDPKSQDQIFLPAFSTKEVQIIDTKFDDGTAASGKIRGVGGSEADGSGFNGDGACQNYGSLDDDIDCSLARIYTGFNID